MLMIFKRWCKAGDVVLMPSCYNDVLFECQADAMYNEDDVCNANLLPVEYDK